MPPRDRTGTVKPTVRVGRSTLAMRELPAKVSSALRRTVVDKHVLLPDMFELTFLDLDNSILREARIEVGTQVEVWAGAASSDKVSRLVVGEVTALELRCEEGVVLSVVRGYSAAHRLQRGRRTEVYAGMKDSDIARQIARRARVDIGRIDETRAVHDHIAQVDQSDWDFLRARAQEVGFEVGVDDGKLYFRGPRRAGATTRLPGSGTAGAVPELVFHSNLVMFASRVTSGNLPTQGVEARLWNPVSGNVEAARQGLSGGAARVSVTPEQVARPFHRMEQPDVTPKGRPQPGARNFGPGPEPGAFVVTGRPVSEGAVAGVALQELAIGASEALSGTFAEAEGLALGEPRIVPGSPVNVVGVPEPFTGMWTVAHVRHVFEDAEMGYRTRFFVSGLQDRSLLGLTTGGAVNQSPGIGNLVIGVVTNISDGSKRHPDRVKVAFPWLDPDYESDWAQVMQLGAGQRSGLVFMPEVGDEVLVGFELGDARRPIVLGGLLSTRGHHGLGGDPVDTSGAVPSVAWRGIVSSSGNRLAFHDEVPPSGRGAPRASEIILGTAQGNLVLDIDQVAGTISLVCDPAAPGSRATAGTITIRCGNAGRINIEAGPNGVVNVDGGGELNLRASRSITIDSGGTLDLSGRQVQIKGTPIKLN